MKMRDLSTPLSVSDFDGPDKKPKTQRVQKPSKEVQLQKRNMYPGDAVFEGSHRSKVDQDITNNVYTKDGKGGIKGVTKKQKTYTHYPEGHRSTSITTSGSRTITTGPDGTTEVVIDICRAPAGALQISLQVQELLRQVLMVQLRLQKEKEVGEVKLILTMLKVI